MGFFELNKWKLKFYFVFCSLVCSVVAVIIWSVFYYLEEQLSNTISLVILLFACLILPLYLLGISILQGKTDLKKRQKAFGTWPFSDLVKIGFKKVYLYESSRWHFSTLVLKGEINGFTIVADVYTKLTPDIVRFKVLVDDEIEHNIEIFKENIERESHCYVLKIPLNNHGLKSAFSLKQELEDLVYLLNKGGLVPLS
ncbi:hypothetical protein [Aureibacter tunicatorum]|uniref:Uncharacterized protein n=1 Tax=Aureibacter tunicatorum TaxID=866807 RepID=A0AAE3XL19_9BACT|nr:hypothetical protein [Aureibacter tunicatorum]MDR6238832.1 hypothetical protein [Aureibacter tunicatorum]BDD05241.1 hypothetical protein AUTU_27240 [Aureibacter tunicatorum]